MRRTGRAGIGRRVAAIIALLLIGLAGCSDMSGGSEAGRPAPSPLLYEVTGADGTVEGWMLGTIHALPPDIAWRTPAVRRIVDAADLLVVEVGDLTGDDRARAIYSALAQSPDQPPLAQRLPPSLHGPLRDLMARAGLSEADVASTETWAAAIALARVDAPGDPANGVDMALLDDFAGRPVRELEGMRGQLSLFDGLPEHSQRAMLAAVVRESAKAREDPERLLRAWLAGDAETIERSTHEVFLADPQLREALLTQRNRRWAGAILPLLEEPPRPLIAVGAAHLVGPEGLAALLEARGYRVRRLS